MKKVTLGPQTLLYPMPAFLIGANVGGKPNFMTAAWSGISSSNPPTLTVAFQHHRLTYKGIRENGVFSVNVPPESLVKETDYCGIVSGNSEDKAKICHFEVFYGKLKAAPMIGQCPVNLECKALHILNLGSHALVVGQIEEVHASEECLTEGVPDILKVHPFLFSVGGRKEYYAVGGKLADAFSVGREIKKAGA